MRYDDQLFAVLGRNASFSPLCVSHWNHNFEAGICTQTILNATERKVLAYAFGAVQSAFSFPLSSLISVFSIGSGDLLWSRALALGRRRPALRSSSCWW